MTGRGLNNCYMTQCVLAHINVFPTDRLNVDTSLHVIDIIGDI